MCRISNGLGHRAEGEKLESSLIVVRAETLFDFRLRNSKAP